MSINNLLPKLTALAANMGGLNKIKPDRLEKYAQENQPELLDFAIFYVDNVPLFTMVGISHYDIEKVLKNLDTSGFSGSFTAAYKLACFVSYCKYKWKKLPCDTIQEMYAICAYQALQSLKPYTAQ